MAIAPTVAIYLYKATDNFELLFWLALLIAGLGMAVDAGVKNEQSKPHASVRPKGEKVRWVSMDRFFLLRGW